MIKKFLLQSDNTIDTGHDYRKHVAFFWFYPLLFLRPQEIDEAARRRFVKRLYIPLPECVARRYIVHHLMAQENCQLNEEEICLIADRTEGV